MLQARWRQQHILKYEINKLHDGKVSSLMVAHRSTAVYMYITVTAQDAVFPKTSCKKYINEWHLYPECYNHAPMTLVFGDYKSYVFHIL
jgi:hypothetical protein